MKIGFCSTTLVVSVRCSFFFNDTATTEIYTLSLHDALPISHVRGFTIRHPAVPEAWRGTYAGLASKEVLDYIASLGVTAVELLDRKSTRLNSSHANISYAVFCLKKKKINHPGIFTPP